LLHGAFAPDATCRTVQSLQADLEQTHVAVFQLSYQTTGILKVIPRLHAGYWQHSHAYALGFGLAERSRVAHILPITPTLATLFAPTVERAQIASKTTDLVARWGT
jgi:non-ribosomal peptide synthetase component E (peptide arylation enzyme)